MKNLIRHNVRLQQADKIVGTENEAKVLQQDFDSKMTEEMADIITANVLKQMAEIVDHDIEFAPLTEDDYRKIKNFETDIVKDGSDPNVKQYLLKLIQLEADNEQKEKPPETKLVQQTPVPWPIHSNTNTKKGSHGKLNRCLQHQKMICCHQDPYHNHHQCLKTHRGTTTSASQQKHKATGKGERDPRM